MARHDREHELQQRVIEILQELHGLEPLKRLLWSEFNYHRINLPLSRWGWKEAASSALAEDPILFAEHHGFYIIYSRLTTDRLLLLSRGPLSHA